VKRTKGRTSVHRVHITFIKHKQLLLTGVLLTALLVLLFGVFSQLPPPDITVQTTGATTIDYSTFLAQVRAGNVVLVSFQDQNMEGALAKPLSSSQITPPR
jgi:cell division protease FtsH